ETMAAKYGMHKQWDPLVRDEIAERLWDNATLADVFESDVVTGATIRQQIEDAKHMYIIPGHVSSVLLATILDPTTMRDADLEIESASDERRVGAIWTGEEVERSFIENMHSGRIPASLSSDVFADQAMIASNYTPRVISRGVGVEIREIRDAIKVSPIEKVLLRGGSIVLLVKEGVSTRYFDVEKIYRLSDSSSEVFEAALAICSLSARQVGRRVLDALDELDFYNE
ncbi:MAG TPA: hypothetical protein VL989_02810, partial [Candidatus Sulfotelmatobacter sp.]|nr:hypothetical protein [Candidatus Sulfotelmatobacter sp.]